MVMSMRTTPACGATLAASVHIVLIRWQFSGGGMIALLYYLVDIVYSSSFYVLNSSPHFLGDGGILATDSWDKASIDDLLNLEDLVCDSGRGGVGQIVVVNSALANTTFGIVGVLANVLL